MSGYVNYDGVGCKEHCHFQGSLPDLQALHTWFAAELLPYLGEPLQRHQTMFLCTACIFHFTAAVKVQTLSTVTSAARNLPMPNQWDVCSNPWWMKTFMLPNLSWLPGYHYIIVSAFAALYLSLVICSIASHEGHVSAIEAFCPFNPHRLCPPFGCHCPQKPAIYQQRW